MAKDKRRKKGFSIKFDLTLAGLFGVGVVCFCVFLWMFLLGIWSGQTVLTSGKYEVTRGKASRPQPQPAATRKAAEPVEQAVPAPLAAAKKQQAGAGKTTGKSGGAPAEPEEDPSFFAVQVGAFKDSSLAAKAVQSWTDKGYDCFSWPPEGADDKFTRVYLGRFDSMLEARRQAAILEDKEKIKPFIVLVPAE